jgi:hypothetical protein
VSEWAPLSDAGRENFSRRTSISFVKKYEENIGIRSRVFALLLIRASSLVGPNTVVGDF